MLKIGDLNKLKVLRETDIGYMLNEQKEEVFLHKNDSNFMNLKPGDLVDAFLYFDNEGRLAATLKTPLITVLKPEMLEVVTVLKNLGVFLKMGINKDLLLSKDDLPADFSLWPQNGDQLYVELKVKGSRLLAKLVEPNSIYDTKPLEIGNKYDFRVIKLGVQGVNLFNKDKQLIFVHKTEMRGIPRLGSLVSSTVLKETEKGYLGSLIANKEVIRFSDADVIMEVLQRYRKIPLTAKSSSEDVNKYFDLSRKAFKRALGLLYKENKIRFTENETILIDGDDNE